MKPNFAVIEKWRTSKDGYSGVFRIDTNKATYQGRPWKLLSNIQKGMFEDLLVLTNVSEGKIKVLYAY